MRRETATLVSAVISVVPGGLVAMLGDGRAQYGLGLLLISLPFYCIAITTLVWMVTKAVSILGFHSLAAYLGASVIVSLLLPILLLQSYGGWVSTIACACGLLTAFFLVPILESKVRQRRKHSTQHSNGSPKTAPLPSDEFKR